MKTTALALLASTSIILAQGTLTPPAGPIAPTMKTLSQVEPRTPLVAGSPGVAIGATGTITISQSGSYYLTGNLIVTGGDGISIFADGVTLDLAGFLISSKAGTPNGNGVGINGSNIAIYNGNIIGGIVFNSAASGDQFTGTGFSSGISTTSPAFKSIRIRDISVQGCDVSGIDANNTGSLVESCIVQTVGRTGIRSEIARNCAASECGGVGIEAGTVSDSRASSTGATAVLADNVANSIGISASAVGRGIDAGRSVSNSYGESSGGDGINCGGNVINSYGSSSVNHGIFATGSVSNSYGFSNGTGTFGDGIAAFRNVSYSYGFSSGDDGIDARETISFSQGRTQGTGVGLESRIAVACTSDGGEDIIDKYLMP